MSKEVLVSFAAVIKVVTRGEKRCVTTLIMTAKKNKELIFARTTVTVTKQKSGTEPFAVEDMVWDITSCNRLRIRRSGNGVMLCSPPVFRELSWIPKWRRNGKKVPAIVYT